MNISSAIYSVLVILSVGVFCRPNSRIPESQNPDGVQFGPDFVPLTNRLSINASQDTSGNTTSQYGNSQVRQNTTAGLENVSTAESAGIRDLIRSESKEIHSTVRNITLRAFDFFDPSLLLRPHDNPGSQRSFWDVSGIRRFNDLIRTGIAVMQNGRR